MNEQLITIAQLTKLLRVSPSTLARWRVTGEGPDFIKVGRKILYSVADVNLWLLERRHRSTADFTVRTKGVAGVQP